MSENFPDSVDVDKLFESTPDVTAPAANPPGIMNNQFRWRWGLTILIVGIVAETIVWNMVDDATYQVMFSLPIISGTPFFLLIWWMCFSGVDRMTRVLGVGAAASLCGLFFSLYRLDGFDGNMFPRFTSRSEPTAEARLAMFINSQADAAEEDGQATQDGDQGVVTWTVNSEQQWGQYRGPARDGIVRDFPDDVDWTTTPRKIWRHPVGSGWSSFSVASLSQPNLDAAAQQLAYLFTQEQRGDQECVVAYNTETGDQVWAHRDDIRFDEALGGPGPRATPTVDGTRLYSLGATGQLNCLNVLTGDKVWTTNILDDAGAKNLDWAMAGSPLVVRNMVIVNAGGENNSGVIAYDKNSGTKIWAVGNDPASYTAPIVATLLGKEQLIIFGGKGPVGHDLDTGVELWRFPWENQSKINAAIPILVDDSSILIGCGYSIGSALLRFSHKGDDWKVTAEWKTTRLKVKFNAPVRLGDFVYGLDEGILTCIDLKTGKRQWKRGRYGYGQLLLCGDILIVQAESSEVAFVRATPDGYEELHSFAALDGKSWNHPVVWNNYLFVRNGEEAACFDLRK